MTTFQSSPSNKESITILGTEFEITPIGIDAVMLDAVFDGITRAAVTYRGSQYRLGGHFRRENGTWEAMTKTGYGSLGLVGEYGSVRPCSEKSKQAITAAASEAINAWLMTRPTILIEAQVRHANNDVYSAERKLAEAEDEVTKAKAALEAKQAILMGYEAGLEGAKAVFSDAGV